MQGFLTVDGVITGHSGLIITVNGASITGNTLIDGTLFVTGECPTCGGVGLGYAQPLFVYHSCRLPAPAYLFFLFFWRPIMLLRRHKPPIVTGCQRRYATCVDAGRDGCDNIGLNASSRWCGRAQLLFGGGRQRSRQLQQVYCRSGLGRHLDRGRHFDCGGARRRWRHRPRRRSGGGRQQVHCRCCDGRYLDQRVVGCGGCYHTLLLSRRLGLHTAELEVGRHGSHETGVHLERQWGGRFHLDAGGGGRNAARLDAGRGRGDDAPLKSGLVLGDAAFSSDVSVSGDTTLAQTLNVGGPTTVGGLAVTVGGINNNFGDITNAGAVSGVTNLTMSGAYPVYYLLDAEWSLRVSFSDLIRSTHSDASSFSLPSQAPFPSHLSALVGISMLRALRRSDPALRWPATWSSTLTSLLSQRPRATPRLLGPSLLLAPPRSPPLLPFRATHS